MIVLLTTLAGALWGTMIARSRGGGRLDVAQHAAALAILGAVLGLFVSIFLARMG